MIEWEKEERGLHKGFDWDAFVIFVWSIIGAIGLVVIAMLMR